MKNEVRSTMIASVVMIGILTAAGIISYMIIKRRKKEIRDTETIPECEALKKYIGTLVEIDQDSVIKSPESYQKLMSTRSRHRKERSSLPMNSRRIRFNEVQSSGQQSSNINDEDQSRFHIPMLTAYFSPE